VISILGEFSSGMSIYPNIGTQADFGGPWEKVHRQGVRRAPPPDLCAIFKFVTGVSAAHYCLLCLIHII